MASKFIRIISLFAILIDVRPIDISSWSPESMNMFAANVKIINDGLFIIKNRPESRLVFAKLHTLKGTLVILDNMMLEELEFPSLNDSQASIRMKNNPLIHMKYVQFLRSKCFKTCEIHANEFVRIFSEDTASQNMY
ncbi:unnamed protein product [Caenorhabditis bovis]|uniref:Receptor L-domain domain-containing protein n=1 Tax=Caenorhabditis bovis TaxID=2654633 RepID=A0A8S1EUL6_9PELO|nr:unnamed protein product [Caenorhabditis bovis]